MHDDDNPRSRDLPAERDEKIERAILIQVLEADSARLGRSELVRRIASDPEDAREREKVLGAIEELIGAGVLRRCGEEVSASAAVLRVDSLLGETC